MNAASSNSLLAAHALLPHGWARDVLLTWDDAGRLTSVVAGVAASGGERTAGVIVPGMPNLHSHAFQRAFAGLSEYRGATDNDTFWTWRDSMYRFALAVSPEQLEVIATQVYVEMLKVGYTSVCEFHYLHHDPQGRAYADPAEMAMRLASAARRAGIGLTLLPVLYQSAGFDDARPRADQRRFIGSVDGVLDIASRMRARGVRVGIAPHSLRAVSPRALDEAVSAAHDVDATMPIHVHIAEQQQEVDDCVASRGARPVAWLLANAPVDARWCLVHATHLDDSELQGVAASGAVVGLCPTTEANLGDGVFPAADYLAASGAWGIGSDSHATVDAAEELRSLEYSQRLTCRRRNVLASAAHPQTADRLWLAAVAGGARASGRPIAGIAVGEQADFVALAAPTLDGLAPSQTLASHIFASHAGNTVRDVWVGGIQRVSGGAHPHEDVAAVDFVAARNALIDRA